MDLLLIGFDFSSFRQFFTCGRLSWLLSRQL